MRKKSALLLTGAALLSSLVAFAACGGGSSSASDKASETVASHEHVFELKSETDPTCTEYGRKEYACMFGGCTETKTEYTEPLKHKVQSGKCTREGCDLEVPTDFLVEVPDDRDAIVLQLTDPQVIDSDQRRYADRIGQSHIDFYKPERRFEICYDYMEEVITEVNPDFIIVTGDLVYGEFDDNGSCFKEFVKFMESFGIPWAPVFGNHENEATIGVDWQSQQLENAENCLFLQRTLTGNGNYTVGIMRNGEIERAFFMLDSNGCGGASAQSLANGHTSTARGFGADQIEWYTAEAGKIRAEYPEVRYSFAFHIQPYVFITALAKYGYDGTRTPVNIFAAANREPTDFGYVAWGVEQWDRDGSVFRGLKALGCDSIFVGHEHRINASVMYDGVRLQYGQKSSEYDSYIRVDTATGKIVADYPNNDGYLPVIGGTVIPLSFETARLGQPYIYLCKDAGGDYFAKYNDSAIVTKGYNK